MSKWLEAAKRASGAVDSQAEPMEPKPVLSVVSVLSEGGRADPSPLDMPRRAAEVAVVATPRQPKIEHAPGSGAEPDAFPYGTACTLGDAPRTWTGRIVSLDEWRRLTEWEKHGQNGRHWNGITQTWEEPE
jgi:hypothetical protein